MDKIYDKMEEKSDVKTKFGGVFTYFTFLPL